MLVLIFIRSLTKAGSFGAVIDAGSFKRLWEFFYLFLFVSQRRQHFWLEVLCLQVVCLAYHPFLVNMTSEERLEGISLHPLKSVIKVSRIKLLEFGAPRSKSL